MGFAFCLYDLQKYPVSLWGCRTPDILEAHLAEQFEGWISGLFVYPLKSSKDMEKILIKCSRKAWPLDISQLPALFQFKFMQIQGVFFVQVN